MTIESQICAFNTAVGIVLICRSLSKFVCTHGEKSLDDVSLDGAERLVSDQDKDLLLFLQRDEVTKPGPLHQPAN